MSRDRGTARQRVDQGYGVICDLDCRPISELIVTDANQEHGIVARLVTMPRQAPRKPA